MTDQQLRSALQRVADDVRVVDLGARVGARRQVLRRRRRVAAVAAPVVAVAVVAALLSAPSEPTAAPPASRSTVPAVDLPATSAEGLDRAALAVTDVDTGDTWLVTAGGRAAHVPVTTESLPGALPTLSARGTVLSFGGPGRATLVRGADRAVTELDLADKQHHQVSVSPDGRTLAYAADNQVDAIELRLVPLDGTPPTSLAVTTTAASGALVPAVWSDDGSGLLVLDGKGATRVDLVPSPRADRGVFVHEDVVLAHGWAAAPDLSHFVMSAPASTSGGQRRWLVLDSTDGNATDVLTRPANDRLMGWTADDRLIWWHRTAYGYAVLSSDTGGRALRPELRVTSVLPNLGATWSEED